MLTLWQLFLQALGNTFCLGKNIFGSVRRNLASMSIITVGIDLATNVFTVHGINDSGMEIVTE